MIPKGICPVMLDGLRFNPISWFLKGEQGAWYDPSDFQPNWRRNLLTWSEDFKNTVWNKQATTISSTLFIAPDNTVTANKLIPDAGSAANHTPYQTSVLTANTSYTVSISVAPAGYEYFGIQIYNGSTFKISIINLTTGAKTQEDTGHSVVVTPQQNGYYRIAITFTAPINATGYFYPVVLNVGTGVPAIIWDPNGTSGAYIWGAQLEQSSSASTYQKITDGIQDYYTVQPQPVLFQDSAGATPVTAVEQPVGLMLDKSKGLALGAELVTNGGPFTNTTGWTGVSTTLSVVSNELKATNNIATVGRADYSIATTIGKMYNVQGVMRADAANTVANSCRLSINTTVQIWIYATSNGVNKYFNLYFTATGSTTDFNFQVASAGAAGAAGDSLIVSNISVKQIAGNHAFQATAGNRPILSARVNLLPKTEDFSDGFWIKGSCTVAPTKYIAPNGLLSANKIQVTSSGQVYVLNVGGNTVSGVTGMKISLSFANAGFDFAYVQINETGGTTKASVARINLTTGETSTAIVAGGGLASFVPIPKQQDNGFWLLSITWVTDSATSAIQPYIGPCDSLAVSTSTISSTNGIYIWGADLRPTNAGSLLPPYQRVNTASDYDTVGFPLYLKANGSSSAMSTNSIDFTGTDAMTVVTGVRKLSDALDVAIELSANSTVIAGNGAFLLITGRTPQKSSFSSRGTATREIYGDSTFSAPMSVVFSGLSSISTPAVYFRNNGVEKSSDSGSQGTGNFGNYPLYLFARAGTQYFLNGQFYGAIIRGAQSDTASVTQTENYMATKTGITF